MDAAGRLIRSVVVAGLCLAVYWSARLAWADWLGRQDSVEVVRRASALAPVDAFLRARLSDWKGAVSRNPYDSESLIHLGLEAEGRGDFPGAEKVLLRAAEVNRLYEPRWALANYYFRRQSWGPFWQWAASAAAISPVTPVPLYSLCREATPDAGLIFDRVVAGRQWLLEGFLYWIESRNELDGLRAVVPRSIELAGPGDHKVLAATTSRTLALGAPADALRFWNRMIERGLLPFGRLDPEAGASLTNGDFRLPLKGEAFNWILTETPGVTSRWEEGRGVRFEFSGNQPENLDLLAQNIPVTGGRQYVLRCRYRTSGIASGAGPVWLAGELAGHPLATNDWDESSLEFVTRPESGLLRLRLSYGRVPGTTRINGVLWLSSVRLDSRVRTESAPGRPARPR